MDLFEKYQDVLQNIEFAIVSIYRENLEMTDYAVIRSLEAIINHYSAEKQERGHGIIRSMKLKRDFSASSICLRMAPGTAIIIRDAWNHTHVS